MNSKIYQIIRSFDPCRPCDNDKVVTRMSMPPTPAAPKVNMLPPTPSTAPPKPVKPPIRPLTVPPKRL